MTERSALNTKPTKSFFESNDVVLLKADKTHQAPEVDALLEELGNTTAAIPYFGLFQPGEEPIHFNGVFYSPKSFLDQLGAEQLSESWSNSKEVLVDLEQISPPSQTPVLPQRVTQLPDAAAN